MNIVKLKSEVMIAACDEDVHGKSFGEGKLVLDVKKKFYGSNLMAWEKLFPLLTEATIANLVGRELVTNAISVGLIEADNVRKVEGVPHAQMVRM